jgi:ribonucleoside-diphosphate reductase beta chain
MPSLLDLTMQGDVATISDESQLRSVKLMDPQQLYRLWERQQWQSHTIDLSRDVADWRRMDAEQQRHLAWLLSSFFIGEERVTTQFTGLVAAYESQAEEAFLATQQVDEARHAQHFNRFYEQVVGYHGSFEDRLVQAREHLNDAFVVLFDEHLVDACQRLLAEPTDVSAKVDFVTAYHMIIEGTLALTGQEFITAHLESEDLLPGFTEGFRNIARDEHRHVAYGTWYLQQALVENPDLGRRVQDKLAELLPIAASVLVPPGLQLGDSYELLGYTSDEVNQFAFTALSRRLKVIGVGLPAIAA